MVEIFLFCLLRIVGISIDSDKKYNDRTFGMPHLLFLWNWVETMPNVIINEAYENSVMEYYLTDGRLKIFLSK